MYPEYAKTAREKRKSDVAYFFETVSKIEKAHAERYKQLLSYLEEGSLYEKPKGKMWKCGVCGFIFEGREVPKNALSADAFKVSTNFYHISIEKDKEYV
jgi:rubrerythrin